MPHSNVDTKSQIFNTALRLFAEKGYENVSVRDIGKAVGIKAGSIYNHFVSKDEILEACFNFYLNNRYNSRLPKEQYEPILRYGTKDEILKILNYCWDEAIQENMFCALYVIYSRIYSDARAKEIFASEINNAVQYSSDFFNYGIAIGRFHEFNVQVISLLVLSARIFIAISTTIKPEQKFEWHKAELDIMDEMVKIVPFIY